MKWRTPDLVVGGGGRSGYQDGYHHYDPVFLWFDTSMMLFLFLFYCYLGGFQGHC